MSEGRKIIDITKHFNSLKVDIKSDLDDWNSVKKELYKKKYSKYP